MKKKRESIHRLEEALSRAYQEKSMPPMHEAFKRNVMREVHRISEDRGQVPSGSGAGLVFRRMVLPFASATALSAVVLLIYMYTSVPVMEQDLFALLTDDSSGLLSTQIF